MLIGLKLDRLLTIDRSIVKKMTEKAVILSSDDQFFILAFHHTSLNAISAGSVTATIQIDGLSLLEIKEVLADCAF